VIFLAHWRAADKISNNTEALSWRAQRGFPRVYTRRAAAFVDENISWEDYVLEGKVVLVTGGSRGIGAATCRLAARHGARVAVNYCNSEGPALQLVDEIVRAGGVAMPVKADVTVCSQVAGMVSTVEAKLGPIDTLVANAAISFPVTSFLEYEWKDFETKIVAEMKAAIFPAKAVIPSMMERGRGNIIFVSSVLSRKASPGFCAHSSAKAALDALARSLAEELGPHGVRVNVIAPGLTITDATSWLSEQQKEAVARLTPLRRVAQPEDIAGAIAVMASDHCNFVNGNYVSIDGGVYMH
jgi:3-oxoacyl-[acyl-carrier protein] reductase